MIYKNPPPVHLNLYNMCFKTHTVFFYQFTLFLGNAAAIGDVFYLILFSLFLNIAYRIRGIPFRLAFTVLLRIEVDFKWLFEVTWNVFKGLYYYFWTLSFLVSVSSRPHEVSLKWIVGLFMAIWKLHRLCRERWDSS